MIKLNSPHLLFNKQRVFTKLMDVEKMSTPGSSKDEVKAIVLYQSSGHQLNDAQTDMLNKIILACKFAPNAVHYLNVRLNPVSIGHLLNSYSPNIILIFGKIDLGKNMAALPKNIPTVLSGVTVLQVEELDKLEKDAAEKKKLWQILQKVLDIK